MATTSPRARRPYRLVWHEETFCSPDEILVFAAGHEFWHFLCHSGQRKRDHETKANCNGFLWLREFKDWPGPGAPVPPVPALPPRPECPDCAAAAPAVSTPARAVTAVSTVEADDDDGATPAVTPAATPAARDGWSQMELFE